MGKQNKPAPAGHWRYVGDGTRIPGVPRRDLQPAETADFDTAIRQVNAAGTVLYVWVAGAAEADAVVLGSVPAPEWVADVTGEGVGTRRREGRADDPSTAGAASFDSGLPASAQDAESAASRETGEAE